MTSFAMTVNGRFTMLHKPAEDPLVSTLERLDGVKIFAIEVWATPAGKSFDDVTVDDNRGDAYLQCAGTADALTVELKVDADHHYVLGRIGAAALDEPQIIYWDNGNGSVQVAANEVYTAREAANLFDDYVTHDANVTLPCTRRLINLAT